MTQSTASEISKILIELFRQHGFTCIGTFALDESNSSQVNYETNEDYQYYDSETAFNDLVRAVEIQNNSVKALEKLVSVAYKFFEASVALPDKFRNVLFKQAPLQPPRLMLNTLSNQTIDIEPILDNQNSRQLISLLKTIQANVNRTDEEMFAALDQIK